MFYCGIGLADMSIAFISKIDLTLGKLTNAIAPSAGTFLTVLINLINFCQAAGVILRVLSLLHLERRNPGATLGVASATVNLV